MVCRQDGYPLPTAKGAITAVLVNGQHEQNAYRQWPGIGCCCSQSVCQLSAESVPLTAGVGTRQPECEPMGCVLLPQVEGWLSVGQEG